MSVVTVMGVRYSFWSPWTAFVVGEVSFKSSLLSWLPGPPVAVTIHPIDSSSVPFDRREPRGIPEPPVGRPPPSAPFDGTT